MCARRSPAAREDGGSARIGRWWSIEERAAMVLCHMGIKKGWWPPYAASPLLQVAIEPKPIGPPPLVQKEKEDAHAAGDDALHGPDGPEEKGQCAGKACNTVQERREGNEGTCHYIARMLSKPNSMRLWAGIIAVPRPLRKHFGEVGDCARYAQGHQ